jgi:signal transduction histidine kinase
VNQKDVAGEIAVEVARQVTDPIRALRDRLGLVVDHIERHVATSTGPTPYPWRSLQTLRQDLAAAYLEATQLARRIEELDRALHDDPPHWFDLAAAVDLGLRLAGHHLGPGPEAERPGPAPGRGIELLFDLGNVAPARGTPGTLALLVARLVAVCARSARAVAGSSLSVRVWNEADWGVVSIADNGGGDPGALELGELARRILAGWGATIDAVSDEGRGCAFELRLVTQRDGATG